uniref:Uncharacterized protein n=1 Tax=Anguilla anguilla TaxID=7936 RepID=A0A0E9TPV3_ANGAN
MPPTTRGQAGTR